MSTDHRLGELRIEASYNVTTAEHTAQQQCQLDQWQLCESPRYYQEQPGDTDLLEVTWLLEESDDTVPFFTDDSATWVQQDNEYLLFPDNCLKTFWIEQRLRPACDEALRDLQNSLDFQERVDKAIQKGYLCICFQVALVLFRFWSWYERRQNRIRD